MEYKSGQIFLPFCHNTRVWQTDGRTDRRTDRNLITIPRLHYMQRGKNQFVCLSVSESDSQSVSQSVSQWILGPPLYLGNGWS